MKLFCVFNSARASIAEYEAPAEDTPVLQCSGVLALLALAGYIVWEKFRA